MMWHTLGFWEAFKAWALGCKSTTFDILSLGFSWMKILVDDRASSPSFYNSWISVACQEHSCKFNHFACGVFKLGVRN